MESPIKRVLGAKSGRGVVEVPVAQSLVQGGGVGDEAAATALSWGLMRAGAAPVTVLETVCGARWLDVPAADRDSAGGLCTVLGRGDPPAGLLNGGLCTLFRGTDPPVALDGGVRAESERGHPPERLVTASLSS